MFVLRLVAVIGAAVAYWLSPKRGSKSPTAAPGSSADQRARPDSTAAKSPSPRPASPEASGDRKSTRLNSSHSQISYAVFCLKKKKTQHNDNLIQHTHRTTLNPLELRPTL